MKKADNCKPSCDTWPWNIMLSCIRSFTHLVSMTTSCSKYCCRSSEPASYPVPNPEKAEQFQNVSLRKAFPAGEAPGSWCWLLSSPQPSLPQPWLCSHAGWSVRGLRWMPHSLQNVELFPWFLPSDDAGLHPKLQQQISASELWNHTMGNQCCTPNFKSES